MLSLERRREHADSGGVIVMRVDAHQHFWRYDSGEFDWIDDSMAHLRRDFLPDALAHEMRGAGFDACVAVQARQTLGETRWLLSLADAYPFIAGVVGWVDLRADDVRAQLEQFAPHPRLVGIRHIVQAEADERFLLQPEFCRGISMLEQFGLAYDLLIYPRHLAVAAELVSRFERQRFILDHLAKPDVRSGELRRWERELRELARRPNVCAKLSGLVTEADGRGRTPAQIRPCLDVAFDCFGVDRLMIGSDWPVCTVAADYARTMAVVTEYIQELPRTAQDAVLGGNAQRCWNLRAPAGTQS